MNALHTLNSQKRTKTVGYAGFKTFAATCDADPDGSGKIIGFYDNQLIGPGWDSGNTWNREHVWPNVRNGDLVENDAHMVRPAATSTNSDRGSRGFGTQSYDPGQYVAYYRGAAARIIFYAAIAETSLQVVDYPFNYNGVGNNNNGYPIGSMGSLSDMLRWNLEYLPSDTSFTGANDLARRTEIQRNERIQNASGGQGNRNPFIDHPEYACKIWGNTNAKTQQICGLSGSNVTLDKTSATIEQGNSTTIKATSSNGGTITWTKSNNNVSLSATTSASGSSITVTGLTVGTTTITAKNGDNVTKTCTITVKQPSVTLSLDKSTLNLAVGAQDNVTATTSNNSEIEVAWSSPNFDKIVDIDWVFTVNSGSPFRVKGLRNGTVEIVFTASNGANATCTVVVGTGIYNENEQTPDPEEPEEPEDPEEPKERRNSNLPLIIGLSAGGGTLLIAGLVVLIVLLVKKKHA